MGNEHQIADMLAKYFEQRVCEYSLANTSRIRARQYTRIQNANANANAKVIIKNRAIYTGYQICLLPADSLLVVVFPGMKWLLFMIFQRCRAGCSHCNQHWFE